METLPAGTPLGRLKVLEVYHYFDGPRLFACANVSGQKFLVFWLGDEDGADKWLYVPVSDTRLREVRSGAISLRRACKDPEDGFVWVVETPFQPNGKAGPTAFDPSELPDEYLPADDSFLSLEEQALSSPVEGSVARLGPETT